MLLFLARLPRVSYSNLDNELPGIRPRVTMTGPLHNSEFMQALSQSASQILKEVIPEDQSPRKQRKFRRPLRVDEEHVRRSIISAGELIKVCDQTIYAIEFLSGFRARKAPTSSSLTRLDYMVYHIENYIIRTNMIMDRALQLVNAVFWLGIPERECRFAVVANNEHVAKTEAGQCLKDLENTLKASRHPRNIIIHQRQYTDDSLEEVETFYILERIHSEDSDSEQDSLDWSRHFCKRLTDQVVREKRREFSAYNQGILNEVAKLFASLLPVFRENQARLKEPD